MKSVRLFRSHQKIVAIAIIRQYTRTERGERETSESGGRAERGRKERWGNIKDMAGNDGGGRMVILSHALSLKLSR